MAEEETVVGKLVYPMEFKLPEKEARKMDFLMKKEPQLNRLYQSFSKGGAAGVATGAGLIAAAVMMLTSGSGFKAVLGAMWDLLGMLSDMVFMQLWPFIKPLLDGLISFIKSGGMKPLIEAIVFFGKVAIVSVISLYEGIKFFGLMLDIMGQQISMATDMIGDIYDGAAQTLGQIGDAIVGGLTWLGRTFEALFTGLTEALNGLLQWLQNLVNAIGGIGGGVGGAVNNAVGGAGQAIGGVGNSLGQLVGGGGTWW